MIVLCPGQGAQHVGMGKAWADTSPEAKAVFERADEVLGLKISELCFAGPEERLNRTDIAQAAIYTTSVACHRALKLEQITATAGLSLGEFTALHLAGAFSFEDGLRLVRLRGQAMQDAAETSSGGMVALIGADEAQAIQLCAAATDGHADSILVPANFNCPGQIVVSGTKDACERAVGVAGTMGLRAAPLVVAGAFHSPLMQPAADRLSAALEQVQWNSPQIMVLSNVTGEPHEVEPAAIKRRLVQQLTNPVRWSESMSWAVANLEGEFHELAPGKVLSGLMRRIDKKTRVVNHAEPGE